MKEYRTTSITVSGNSSFEREFKTPMPQGGGWTLDKQTSHGANEQDWSFETVLFTWVREMPKEEAKK